MKLEINKTDAEDLMQEFIGQPRSTPVLDKVIEELAVEAEDLGNVEGDITEPFDPSEIDVDISNVNLGSLIDDLRDDIIDFNTDFQRASDVWDDRKKSRLIESILLGLPLPSFYFSENPFTKKFDIIDGLQRLCAISDFVIKNKLVLKGLEFLSSYNGRCYSDLLRPDQRRISALKITKNTLRKGTPNDVKYVIFQRVNSAGVPLEPQEMRHALNQGAAANLIADMANLDSFIMATNRSIKTRRMQDRDFVNRFVAFYLNYDKYGGELDAFMNNAMGDLNRMDNDKRAEIRTIFDSTMSCCYHIFGDDAFRKRYNVSDRRKPISKAVFDTLSVNIALFSDEQRITLKNKADEVRLAMIGLFNNEQFMYSISTATGQSSNVVIRFGMVREMLEKILGDDK